MDKKELVVQEVKSGGSVMRQVSQNSVDQLFDDLMREIVAKKVCEEAKKTPESPACLKTEELYSLHSRYLSEERMKEAIRHLAMCPRCLFNYHEVCLDMDEWEDIKNDNSELPPEVLVFIDRYEPAFMEMVKQNRGDEGI